MKFGMTYEQLEKQHNQFITREVFLWFPKRLWTGDIAWLEKVRRRSRYDLSGKKSHDYFSLDIK